MPLLGRYIGVVVLLPPSPHPPVGPSPQGEGMWDRASEIGKEGA